MLYFLDSGVGYNATVFPNMPISLYHRRGAL